MHAAAITFKLRKGICIRLVVDESSFAVGCEYLEKFEYSRLGHLPLDVNTIVLFCILGLVGPSR